MGESEISPGRGPEPFGQLELKIIWFRPEAGLEKRINEHQIKIEIENNLEIPDRNLILYWKKEIHSFKIFLERAKKRL